MQVPVKTRVAPLLLLSCLVWVAGCSAYTLGRRRADMVAVNTTSPTWANGIGTLVQTKCASCHQEIRASYVPANVPHDSPAPSGVQHFMNTIASGAVFSGADTASMARIALIRRRIFATPEKPMPPSFATPLDSDELLALQVFLDNLLPAGTGVGTGLCTPGGSTTLAYADVEPTISGTCAVAGCHGSGAVGDAQPPFSSLRLVQHFRNAMIPYVSTGYMPKGEGSIATTTAGEQLLNWLCYTPDAVDPDPNQPVPSQ